MNKEEITNNDVAELTIRHWSAEGQRAFVSNQPHTQPDMSLWSDKDRKAYFLQQPCSPNAHGFFESHKDDLRKEIKDVLRTVCEYQLFSPCITYDRTVLDEPLELLHALTEPETFSEKEIHRWHDQATGEVFNHAVTYLNEHPDHEAAPRFFKLYPECRGNSAELPFAQIQELVKRADKHELETGECR